MSDVGKVGKERGGPEPSESKRKKKHDTEAFKEMMKVGKVRETDPEEKRKRKKQAEAEEEFKAKQRSDVPKQGLEAEPKEPSPYEPKKTRAPLPQAEGPVPPSTPPPFQAPQPGEEPQKPQGPQETEGGTQPQQRQPRKAQEQQPSARTKKKKEPTTGPAHPAKKPSTTVSKKAIEQKIQEGVVPYQAPPTPKEEKKEKVKEGQTTEGIVPPPLPPGAWESTKEEKKQMGKQAPLEAEAKPLPALEAPPSFPQAAPPPLVAPFAHLPPHVAQLFERMAGVMTVMHESGITQTTINLENPQFAHSVFYGAQVMITEFSTAPKAFNIELLGNQQAVALFQGNAEELVAAFQAGNYNFKVNRVDTGYLPPSAAVKRKKAQRVKRKRKG